MQFQRKIGIDLSKIFRHRFRFQTTNLILKKKLTIQIPRRNNVEICNHKPLQTASHQMHQHIRSKSSRTGNPNGHLPETLLFF